MSRITCEKCNDYVPDMTIQVVDGLALCPSCRIKLAEKRNPLHVLNIPTPVRKITINIKFE